MRPENDVVSVLATRDLHTGVRCGEFCAGAALNFSVISIIESRNIFIIVRELRVNMVSWSDRMVLCVDVTRLCKCWMNLARVNCGSLKYNMLDFCKKYHYNYVDDFFMLDLLDCRSWAMFDGCDCVLWVRWEMCFKVFSSCLRNVVELWTVSEWFWYEIDVKLAAYNDDDIIFCSIDFWMISRFVAFLVKKKSTRWNY